jgi:excinuclease ABC subunit A
MRQLVDDGQTVLVVEHHLDVIKYADWGIDLGPSEGESGGYVVGEGTPKGIGNTPQSLTAKYHSPLHSETSERLLDECILRGMANSNTPQ